MSMAKKVTKKTKTVKKKKKTTLEKLDTQLTAYGHQASAIARRAGARDLVAQCRKHSQMIVASMVNIIKNGNDRDKIQAAKLLLDRGYGKAPITVVQTQKLSDKQLRAAVEAIRLKRASAAFEAPEPLKKKAQ